MHRDLKSENFLYADERDDSLLKVIDFGLSVFFRLGEHFSKVGGQLLLYGTGGSPAELWARGRRLERRRHPLHPAVRSPPFLETVEGVARAILRGVVDFKRDPCPQISDSAKNLVRRMLEQDPKHRLTAQQVLEWEEDGLGGNFDSLSISCRFISGFVQSAAETRISQVDIVASRRNRTKREPARREISSLPLRGCETPVSGEEVAQEAPVLQAVQVSGL
ncbi:hypothetical protein Taro_052114 [Colocasia esculenta]|uniref:Protein kinase domain-containing protein n=1 Tax=Colocasia esculenta TaxID=4460 RepID=A0A843XHR2_COLES|nr:hypothetical protein [Colocasia esculenta]